jgi:hypothetical protein
MRGEVPVNLNTVIKRVNEAKLRTRDTISSAKHFGPTSKELHSKLIEVRNNMGPVPRWAHSEVYGYQQALTDSLYETSLIYGVEFDGEFFSCHSDREDYYEKKGLSPREFHELGEKPAAVRGHFWSTTSNLKPFFVG